MADLNEVRLIGRLTRDPETRQAGQTQLCEFGLATGRKFKGQDGSTREETTFVDVTAWGKLAEVIAKYMKKGRQIFIGGRLKFDSWEDKQSGQKRSKLAVVAENVQFLDGPKHGEQGELEDKNNWQEKDSNMPGNYGQYVKPPAAVTAGMGEPPEWGEEMGTPPF